MTERPGDGDLDVDAAWAVIVAHWDQDDLRVVTDDEGASTSADPDGPEAGSTMTWTEAEGWSGAPADSTLPLGPQPAASGEVRPVGRSRRRDDELDTDQDAPSLGWDAIRSHVGGEGVRSSSRDDDVSGPLAALDEHFVPSDPPSLRPTDMMSALAWLGALGGPVFLLVAALAWRDAPSVLIGAAVLAFVAGFVTLVVRMPDEREDEDDGAVV